MAIVVASAGFIAPRAVHADVIDRGVVVRLEAGEIYFDLGARPGLTVGTPLRLKRPLAIKHPVTGKLVRDELPLAEGVVTAVGTSLSMVRLAPEDAAAVRVGDLVEVRLPRVEPEPPPAPAPPPVETTLPTVPPATARVLAVWARTSGARLDARIAAWEEYLADGAEEPFAGRVREHLEVLRAEEAIQRGSVTEPATGTPVLTGIDHASPRAADPGEPLALAFAERDPTQVVSAWVHYRSRGAATFRKAPLRRDGDGYLRGEVPADAVAAPGLEYFVEAALDRGAVGAAVGTPEEPVIVAVEEAPSRLFVDRRARSRVSLMTTYLDYATFDQRPGEHRDTFFQMEADFFYRLRTTLYGIRTGFGVINGHGGRVDPDPDEEQGAGFNYGYTELELRLPHALALLGRLVAGVGDDGLAFGAEGRLRLGPEDDTNVTFGASTIEDVGSLSEIRMQWRAFRAVPLGFAVALTDQPNNGDLGVRFSTDVGWRARSWLQPTVRVSYQGRTVDHSGIGAGLGLVFDW